jgi:mannose-6-phosphate isomerase-like protein (cupin superfamily)
MSQQPEQMESGALPALQLFPEPILKLPLADVPLAGITAHLSQSETHQILFMTFREDTTLPEHSHEAQWGVVFEGEIDFTIGGRTATYRKGDRYFIPRGVLHSGFIHAGFAAMDFFDQPDRYRAK